jgi:hypothetical protein
MPLMYADRPVRAGTQLVADALAVAGAWAGVTLALWTYHQVDRLAEPGRRLEDAGNSLSDGLGSAGDRAQRVPVVGGDLREPFDTASRAARGVAAAGQDFQGAVHRIALIVACLVAVPAAVWVLGWLLLRLRWWRRAASARQLAAAGADASLFALRALANQPLPALARAARRAAPAGARSTDLVAGWSAGDPAVIAALADLELAGLGVRGPIR